MVDFCCIELSLVVEIDGVTIANGNLVFADVDGVVVVPGDVEDEVIQRAWEKVHAENVVRESIRGGMSASAAFARYGVL